jgi:hypothetical protein
MRRALVPSVVTGLLLGAVPSSFVAAQGAPISRRVIVELSPGSVEVDLEHALRGDEARSFFASVDKNADGRLSPEEVEAALVPWRRERRRHWYVLLDGRRAKMPFPYEGVISPTSELADALSVASVARFPIGPGEHTLAFVDLESSAFGETQVVFRARDGASIAASGLGDPADVTQTLTYGREASGEARITVRGAVPREPLNKKAMAVFVTTIALSIASALWSLTKRRGDPSLHA